MKGQLRPDRWSYGGVTLEELIEIVGRYYERSGYNAASPSTLMLGVMEEVGELSEQILLQECDDYKTRQDKDEVFIGDEVGDVIVYLLSLCNALDIIPTFRKLHGS